MFNNVLHRNRAEADTAAAGSDERIVDERDRNARLAEEQVTADHAGRRPWFGGRAAQRTAVPATDVDDRTVVERPVAPEDERVTEPVEVERRPWAHSSGSAICGLVIGVLALAATFTGLLAPLGVAAGVIGALVSLVGLVRASRRGVTGHSAAFVGLVASLAAVILGVLAIQGQLSWLNSDTDEVAKLHTWLNNNFSWMERW